MRTYKRTHPWISFEVDLSAAGPRLWMMLGQCQSKSHHLANVPLLPETATELHQIYLAKGIQATTAIEGNTLTEEEVRRHIEGQLEVAPSRQYLQQEVDNILQACNAITSSVDSNVAIALNPPAVKAMNAQVLNGLTLEEEIVPGEIRTHSVTVGTAYRGAPPEDCEYLLDRLCIWLGSDAFKPPERMKEYDAVFALLKAIVAHLYLAWIHPFGDGNGRTARLVEFQILLVSGIPAPAAHLLSNHYNQTRTEYYRQLDRASKLQGDVLPFIEYAVQGFLDGLAEQLRLVWEQQHDVTWRNLVHEFFRDKIAETDVRRRHLVLDLSNHGGVVPRDKLSELTPRLAKAYARKTERTLSRDINALLETGLIARERGGFRARTEIVLAYLPTQANV